MSFVLDRYIYTLSSLKVVFFVYTCEHLSHVHNCAESMEEEQSQRTINSVDLEFIAF